jgi:hypothetical protein
MEVTTMTRLTVISICFIVVGLMFVGIAAADTIILVVASTDLSEQDAQIRDHLEGLGFVVEPRAHDAEHPGDISAASGVYIAESISSANIEDKYNDSAIPVIIAEAYVLDNMHFTPNQDTLILPEDQTSILIEDSDHPIAGGLTGEVQVIDSPAMIQSCANMQDDVPDAQIVATIGGNACIAAYEAGVTLADGTSVTPDRRVFIFPHTNTIGAGMTDDGWGLVERSVLWAMRQITAVSPSGKLASTWAEIKQ